MGEKFAWFFDVILIGILLVCMYNGSKKGFVKSVLVVVAYFVAFFAAFFASKAITPTIYDKVVKTRSEKVIEQNMDNINIHNSVKGAIKAQKFDFEITDEQIDKILASGSDFAGSLEKVAKDAGSSLTKEDIESKSDKVFSTSVILDCIRGKIPDNVYKQTETFLNKSKTSVDDIVKALNNPSKEEGAKELTEVAVKPLASLATNIILFFIFFIVFMVIIRIVLNIITKAISIVPIVGPLNSFLGLVLGIVQGLFIIFIIALLVKVIITTTNNQIIMFNETTLEKTKLFRLIYNLKIFK